jgi:putative transposase
VTFAVSCVRACHLAQFSRAANGRTFRVLTVVEQWSRQSPILEVASSLSGATVGVALDRVLAAGAAPRSITVDHGTEFMSRALEDWAYQRGVQLDFIRPGKPVENAFIESFNGRLRDECLNVHQFTSIADAKPKSKRGESTTISAAHTTRSGT